MSLNKQFTYTKRKCQICVIPWLHWDTNDKGKCIYKCWNEILV